MNRRSFLMMGAAAAGFASLSAAEARASRVQVYKSPTCGCCSAWIDHIKRAGFVVDVYDVDQDALYALKARSGITPELASCHTAFVDRYFIEGHVPADDIARLLVQQTEALGLTVPGMPIGSPGMEMGNQREEFDTLLVLGNGSTEVFRRHG